MIVRSAERGTALLASLLVATALVGFATTYLLVSYGGYESGAREVAAIRARFASDEGLQRAMAELKTGVDIGGDGLGRVQFTGTDERDIDVTATALGGNLWRLHSRGDVTRAALACDALVELVPPQSLFFPVRAAITAEGPVTTTGNINIDGRDWNAAGTMVVAPGVFGISSVMSISNNGSSTVGGKGIAPTRPVPAAVKEPFAVWRDYADNDGDGAADEELFDGIDNDHDGRIDEDTSNYPSSPDTLFHLPAGTLMAAAMARGTYFTSQSQIDSYIAANGGRLPGGKIFYCSFPTWLPVNLGNGFNDPPSIIIHHNATGTALMKNLHGGFKGLILSDFVEHINGDFQLLGGLVSFADEAVGNTFGNGNATVRYSSQVLSNLPSAAAVSDVRLRAWSRSTSN